MTLSQVQIVARPENNLDALLINLDGSEHQLEPKADVFLGLLFEKPDTCEALVVSVRKTEDGQ